MRRASAAIALALIAVLVFSQVGVGAASSTQLRLGLPSYEKLEPDFARELTAEGSKATGKEMHGGINNGQSYKSPADLGPLGSRDMRGHGRKGLAILVDWPATLEFSDVPGVNYPQLGTTVFEDLLNGDTYDPYTMDMFQWLQEYNPPTDRTLKNYFSEVSYGQFGMDVDVVGWVTLPHDYHYYLGQDLGYYNENGDAHIGELVQDAIEGADAMGVDFSQYAVDAQPGDFDELYNDGRTIIYDADGNPVTKVVPNLFIIHRGTGAEYNLDPNIIWSHKWDILSAQYYGQYWQTGTLPNEDQLRYLVLDGVAINTYNTVPEVGQDIEEYYTAPRGLPRRPPSPPYVGVFAHEFSHVLGLPDEYDYGYDSEGTGMYSLMAGGSWGRDIQNRWFSGNSPVHQDAWAKSYLHFLTLTDLTLTEAPQHWTLQPAETNPSALRVVVPGSNGRELFVLENRQQIGFDRGLAYNIHSWGYNDGHEADLHGLLVYQIDENVFQRNFDRPNEAQNWSWDKRGNNFTNASTGEKHYGISLVQADGNYDLEHGYNDADAGDPFPGLSGVTKLSAWPAAKTASTVSWYDWGLDNRSITGITIDNITENEDGSVTFDIYLAQ